MGCTGSKSEQTLTPALKAKPAEGASFNVEGAKADSAKNVEAMPGADGLIHKTIKQLDKCG